MDNTIEGMAARLARTPGVRAVALGGSRARGSHRPDSDWDLGIYYRGGVDAGALAALASELTGRPVEVAGPGGWGPWVDGGAWLSLDGVPVDWILRDPTGSSGSGRAAWPGVSRRVRSLGTRWASGRRRMRARWPCAAY